MYKLNKKGETKGALMLFKVAQFNVAVPGANAKDLPGQAIDLVNRLNAHPEVNDT